jgi:pilus assembly protein CpaB
MKKPIVPLLIALVLAIGAGVAVYAFARSSDERALADQQPVPVLVSAAVVPAGTTLRSALEDGLIEQSLVPVALRPAAAVVEVSSTTGELIATADLPAGQVILDGAFAADLPDIAPIDIPDGKFAVSVLLEAPAKVGPFLRPGSSIAVYATAGLDSSQAGGPEVLATRAILDKVTVLAIGPVTEKEEDDAGDGTWDQTLVTVAVDDTQAAKLIHGAQTGSLYLALLADGAEPAGSTQVTNAELLAQP